MSANDFHEAKAQECEHMADKTSDPWLKARWLKMARAWRSLMQGPHKPPRPDPPSG